MKKMFLAGLACALIGLGMVARADDACCESKGGSVQQRLAEIDLNILLDQYQQLKSIAAKAEVEYLVAVAEAEAADAVRANEKQLSMMLERHQGLLLRANQLRDKALALGAEVSVAAK